MLQVRQQSKEISHRLLERAKKIAKEELSKLEKDPKSELRQMHDKKIMEIQEKYQEDLEDIGQAHALAASQPDVDAIIEEEEKKARAMALKRGKEAAQRLREAKQVTKAIFIYLYFNTIFIRNYFCCNIIDYIISRRIMQK